MVLPEENDKQEASSNIPKITFEELRIFLAQIMRDGKQHEVKQLIVKFDAKKLSDISDDKYQALLDEARKI